MLVFLFLAGLLHGDMGQGDRDDVISGFKKKAFPILVATDVAGNTLAHGVYVRSISAGVCSCIDY